MSWLRTGALLALSLPCMLGPAPSGWAAFEVEDASPSALGAVSTDGAWLLSADDPPEEPAVAASRATLFGAAGLAFDQVSVFGRRGSRAAQLEYAVLSMPGAREAAWRLKVLECAAPAISLALAAERLDCSSEGAQRWGGWALGGAASASALGGSARIWVGGDRLLRTGALERAAVPASVSVGAGIRAGGAAISALDRWEPDGTHSPRLILDLPLGPSARVRFGRGSAPGRIGAALTLWVSLLEIQCGRLEYAFAGTITSVRVGISRAKERRPAVRDLL